jgi:hypothetical protein
MPCPRQALLDYGVGIYDCKQSSPTDAQLRSLLVREMMGDLRPMVRERRLTALIYYSWTGDPPFEVYPCGALTENGRWRLRLYGRSIEKKFTPNFWVETRQCWPVWNAAYSSCRVTGFLTSNCCVRPGRRSSHVLNR